MVFNKEIPEEEQQPKQQSNDESSDEEEDYGITCKICEILWIELTD